MDAHPGPLSQQAVADRLGLTKGTVSRQIEAAVDAGLMTVTVAAHTRREHALALTRAGAAIVRKGDTLAQDSRRLLADAIEPDDVANLVRALGQLLHTLEA